MAASPPPAAGDEPAPSNGNGNSNSNSSSSSSTDPFESFKRTPLPPRVLEFLERARELYRDGPGLERVLAEPENQWLGGELAGNRDATKLSVILMGDLAKQRMKG